MRALTRIERANSQFSTVQLGLSDSKHVSLVPHDAPEVRHGWLACQRGASAAPPGAATVEWVVMQQKVEAVYENGVFRPLEPVSLKEAEQVTLTISDPSVGRSRRDLDIVERARKEVAAFGTVPSIEELRSALAVIPGNLSEDVIRERGDY